MARHEDGDPRFDLADFVQPGDYSKKPIARFGRALSLSPGTALAAAFWRLTGRRLRSRYRLNAIIGDHLKFDPRRQILPVETASTKAGSATPPASCAIIVPVFSQAEAGVPLAASLESISREDAPDLSVFVPVAAQADRRAVVSSAHQSDRIVPVADAKSRADLVNAIAESCHHDILIVLEPGCTLRKGAVARAAQALASGAVVAYADEIVRRRDHPRVLPLLKPDFDEDLLLRLDFVGPFLAARRADFTELGGYRSETEGAEARDLVLRASAARGETAVAHIAEPIHDRDETVAATRPVTARAATLAARRAGTMEHMRRSGARGHVTDAQGGRLVLSRELAEPLPLVSIIVPTRDRVDLFEPCVRGVLDRTDYPRLELVVADNGSHEPATLALYEALRSDERVRIVDASGPFNFSKICNVAAAASQGEILLFLNNDIEVRDGGWLRAMVAEAVRPEIGAVGAMLLYPNETVQHAGVAVGVRGVAAHAFQFFPFGHPGYLWLLATTRRCSAVTAACLAVSRDKFDAVGGFDAEAFPVSLNDVDLCLKLNQAGYRTLYVAEACLTHKESASRRSDRASSQTERWQREIAAFRDRWGDVISRDPWYGSAFGQVTADFSHAVAAPADRARD